MKNSSEDIYFTKALDTYLFAHKYQGSRGFKDWCGHCSVSAMERRLVVVDQDGASNV